MKLHLSTVEATTGRTQRSNLARYKKRTRWYHYVKHYLFLLPFFVLFGLFFLYPAIFGVSMSFTDWDGIDPANFVGLQNYISIVHSKEFVHAFSNLFSYVLLDVPIGIVLAFALALLVNSFTGRFGNFLRITYFLPTIVPLFLTATMWTWLLSYFSIPNTLLRHIGLSIDWTDASTAIPRLVIIDLWRSSGFNMIILLAGLKNIPQEYYDAAKVDGANAWQRIRYITIPQMEPIIFLVVVVAFINTFQIFDLPWLLSVSTFSLYGGNTGEFLFPTIDMLGRGIGHLEFGAASAYAVILLILILLVTSIQFVIRRRQ